MPPAASALPADLRPELQAGGTSDLKASSRDTQPRAKRNTSLYLKGPSRWSLLQLETL